MISASSIWGILDSVPDPEVPVLSVVDLGIVRDVAVINTDTGIDVAVTITPTYSGCPAMDVVALNIRIALAGRGIRTVQIVQQLSPPWTTDWMTEEGRRKLKEYGIAPPARHSSQGQNLFEEDEVNCPKCGSGDTVLVSQFGPTACKSLYKCNTCKEPFEHFKCH